MWNGTAFGDVSPAQAKLTFAAWAHTNGFVLVGVAVGTTVLVSVAVGASVLVAVAVGTSVLVGVSVAAGTVSVGVAVGTTVLVSVAVGGTGVSVAVGSRVDVAVGVGLTGHSPGRQMIPSPLVAGLKSVSLNGVSLPFMPSPRFARPHRPIGQPEGPLHGNPASSVHRQQ
ncbi:MAG: hypothetical protein DIKNOCCD_02051 [bacterium]|nr:hypothetical protein [bacterium]